MPTPLKNGFTLYTPEEMTNEMYHHEVDGVSGTGLCILQFKSPAHYRYGEMKESPALLFGIASHTAMLEPEKFEDEVVCELDRADYPDALNSDVEMKTWLREKGIPGLSKLKKPELIAAIKATGEEVEFWPEILEKFKKENEGKVKIKKNDYDGLMKMRGVMFNQPRFAKMLTGGTAELSIVGDIKLPSGRVVTVKIRPDLLTTDFEDVDYKTCLDASAEKFGRDAFKLGYYLKMAMRHDILAMAYGREPKDMILLAQEKTAPYIPQDYAFSDEQLAIGRRQYIEALETYAKCMETGIWPSYANATLPLELCYDANKELDTYGGFDFNELAGLQKTKLINW